MKSKIESLAEEFYVEKWIFGVSYYECLEQAKEYFEYEEKKEIEDNEN